MGRIYTVMVGSAEIVRSAYKVNASIMIPSSPVEITVPYGTYVAILEKYYIPTDVMIIDEFGGVFSGIPIVWDYDRYFRETAGKSFITGKFDVPAGLSVTTNIINAVITVSAPTAYPVYAGTFFSGQDINHCLPPYNGEDKETYDQLIPLTGCMRCGQDRGMFDVRQQL